MRKHSDRNQYRSEGVFSSFQSSISASIASYTEHIKPRHDWRIEVMKQKKQTNIYRNSDFGYLQQHKPKRWSYVFIILCRTIVFQNDTNAFYKYRLKYCPFLQNNQLLLQKFNLTAVKSAVSEYEGLWLGFVLMTYSYSNEQRNLKIVKTFRQNTHEKHPQADTHK